MAVKTWYVLNTAAASPGYFGQLQDGGTAPTAANCSFGFAPGKLAVGSYCKARLGASGTATATSTGSYVGSASSPLFGSGATNTTAGDCFISPTAYNGSFVAGTWTFTFNMIAGTVTLTGRLGLRVWASTSSQGSGARELTSGEVFTNSAAINSTTVATALTYSWSAPAITLTNEYIFFQLEWQEQTSAGSNNSDSALFRVGSSIATTNYSPVPIDAGTFSLAGAGTVPATVLSQIQNLKAPAVAAAAASDVIDGSLFAWYKFEDLTTTDSSGNSNTGVVNGSPTLGPGKAGQGLVCAAGNKSVQFTTTPGLPSATSSFSVMAWVSCTYTDRCIFGGRRYSNGNPVIDLQIGYNGVNNSGSTPSVIIRDDNGTGLTYLNSTTSVTDGAFHHVAAVFNGSPGINSQTLTLYVDGVQAATATAPLQTSITLDYNGCAVCYESTSSASIQGFVGTIDDFRFYTRALSASEISQVYTAAGSGLPQINLLMHFDSDYSDATNRHTAMTVNGTFPIASPGYFGAGYANATSETSGHCNINITDNPSDFTFAGDFTVDCWFSYAPVGYNGCDFFDIGNATLQLWIGYYWTGSANILVLYGTVGTVSINDTVSFLTSTWTHVALTRHGSNIYLFKNGTLVGSGTSSGTLTPTGGAYVGGGSSNSGTGGGYPMVSSSIDELRVINGFAAYTSNFTPPTAPYSTGGGAASPGDIPAFGGGGGLGANLVKYVPPIIITPNAMTGLGALSAAVVAQTLANANFAGAGAINAVPTGLLLLAQPNALNGAGALNAIPTQQRLAAQTGLAGVGAFAAIPTQQRLAASTGLAGAGALGGDLEKLAAGTQWQGSAGPVGAGQLIAAAAQLMVLAPRWPGTVTASSTELAGSAGAGYAQLNNLTMRQVIGPSDRAGPLYNQIRISWNLTNSNAVGGQILDAWIGFQATSGNAWNFDGNQVRLTFNGGVNFANIPAGIVTSDWVNFQDDLSKNLIVSAYANQPTSGYIEYSANNYNDAATHLYYTSSTGLDISGVTAPTTGMVSVAMQIVSKVETQQVVGALPASLPPVVGSGALGGALIQRLNLVLPAGSAGTQWDPSNLQDSDTINGWAVTDPSSNVQGSTRTTVSHATGKWQFEMVFSGASNWTNFGVGICQASHASNIWLGYDSVSWGFWAAGGLFFGGSSAYDNSLVAWNIGDVVGILIDADAGKLWLTTNGYDAGGSGTGNAFAGTGGYSIAAGVAWFPAVSIWNGAGSNTATANFGALTYPTAGFRAWDATTGTLAGAGALGSSALTQALASANFAGAGALVGNLQRLGTQWPTQFGTAGTGALVAPAVNLWLAANSALAGAGALAADAQKLAAFTQWQGQAGLAGAGALTAPASMLMPIAPMLSGAATLTAVPVQQQLASGALWTGSGGLGASALSQALAAASFAGAGAVTAPASMAQAAQANLAGAGAVTAAALSQALAASTLSGLGSLSAAAQQALTTAASWAGAGLLSTSPAQLLSTTPSTLLGSGALASPAGQLLLPAVPTALAGAGYLQAGVSLQLLAMAVSTAGAGALSFNPNQWMTLTAPLAGAGYLGADLVKTGMQTLQGSAAGVGSLSAAPWQVMQALAGWPGAGTLAAQPQLRLLAVPTALAGAGAVAATPAYQWLSAPPTAWAGIGSWQAASVLRLSTGGLWGGAGTLQGAPSQNLSTTSLWSGAGGLAGDAQKYTGGVLQQINPGDILAMAGLGALTAPAAGLLLATGIAPWGGLGALTAPATLLLLGAGTLSLAGAGSFASPAARQLLSSSTAWSGVGSLGADLVKIGLQLGSAGLAGVGALTAPTLSQSMAAQGGWAGAGLLGADLTKLGAQFGSAGLGGFGALTAAAVQAMQSQATLPGLGNLIASSAQVMQSQATLAGTGSFGAFLGSIGQQFAAAGLTGFGALTAAFIQRMQGQAALAAAGALAATTTQLLRATALWPGGGYLGADLTSIGQQTAAAGLNGLGSLGSGANLALSVAGQWAGSATARAAASLALNVQPQSWSGQGQMAVPPASLMGQIGTGLAGAGSLGAHILLVPGGSQIWSASGSLIASAIIRMPVKSAFAGGGALAAPAASLNLSSKAQWAGAGSAASLLNALLAPLLQLQGAGKLGAGLGIPSLLAAQFAGAGGLQITLLIHSIRTAYMTGTISGKLTLQGQLPTTDMLIGQRNISNATFIGNAPQPLIIVDH